TSVSTHDRDVFVLMVRSPSREGGTSLRTLRSFPYEALQTGFLYGRSRGAVNSRSFLAHRLPRNAREVNEDLVTASADLSRHASGRRLERTRRHRPSRIREG